LDQLFGQQNSLKPCVGVRQHDSLNEQSGRKRTGRKPIHPIKRASSPHLAFRGGAVELNEWTSTANGDARFRFGRTGLKRECSGRRCRRGACLCSRSLRHLPCRRTQQRVASGRRHRAELSGYYKHQGDDGDGSPGVPDDLAPKDAKPDPHARTDSGRVRLHPELT
jgi:hypothetical protein